MLTIFTEYLEDTYKTVRQLLLLKKSYVALNHLMRRLNI